MIERAKVSQNSSVKKKVNFQVLGSRVASIAALETAAVLGGWTIPYLTLGDAIQFDLNNGLRILNEFKSRNFYLHKFLGLLNRIYVTTGRYARVKNTNYIKGQIFKQFLTDTNVGRASIHLRSDKKILDWWIKSHIVTKWKKEWTSLDGHRQTKVWLGEPDPDLAKILMRLNRKDLGHCLQWFTGHGWWRRHLHLAGLEDTPQCRGCEEDDAEETPHHLFTDCPAFADVRLDFFGTRYPDFLSDASKNWEKVIGFSLVAEIQELATPIYQSSKVNSKEITQ